MLAAILAAPDKTEDLLYLAELMIAVQQYDRARSLAATVEVKDTIPNELLGVLVAVGENERANALAKRFGLGRIVEAYASGSLRLPDPCFDVSNWWGRSRKAYLVNMAVDGRKFQRLNRAGEATSGSVDEIELPDFLRQNLDIVGGPDAAASVKAAEWIAEDIRRLAEEYRRVHGPYRR